MSEIVNHAVKPVFLSKVQREILHKQEEIAEQNRHREQDQSTNRKRYCDEDVKEENLKTLNQRYLLPKKPRTLPRKKSRFCPDWDVGEDTSGDINYEAPLLFGRGLRGGIDTSLQKKQVIERVHEDQKHWSKKKLEEMRERDWRIFQEDHSISYKWWRSRFIRPMRNWKESNLNLNLLKAVDRLRYRTPTPIQMAAIPLGLQNCDVIGIAETGSGKTAAFVLPMLNYISGLPPKTDNNEAQGPLAVVLAPTRELAQQIERETVRLSRYLDIKVASIVGGLSIAEQGFKISQGCEVVIATPGRLIDCLERRYAVLNRCTYVVLDEADRMIDLGFESQIVDVLEAMPCSNLKPENDDELLDEKKNYRTTYMFTATMSPGVEKLARKFLRNPVVVTVGSSGHANHRISQQVIMMKESQKLHKLKKITDEIGDKTAIVFVKDKKSADFVSSSLNRDKDRCSVTAFHSGMSQERRERSLEGFRTRKYGVLVATDVASRGIDVPDVAYVINYDMPDSIDLYTHRIGRTGRAGKTGIAITFLTLSDTKVFYDLKQKLIQSNSPVPHELARHEASNLKPGTNPDRALIF